MREGNDRETKKGLTKFAATGSISTGRGRKWSCTFGTGAGTMVIVPVIAETVTDHEAAPLRASGRSLAEASIRHRQGARARTAFTLIELLVVIGIVALLMAIFLPALQRVRSQAKAVACQARLRQWGVTLAMLAHDDDGRLPISAGLFTGAGASWSEFRIGNTDINLYHSKFIFCPMATRLELRPDRQLPIEAREATYVGGKSTAWCTRITFLDPSSPAVEVSGSYGFNGRHISMHGLDRRVHTLDKYPGSARNNVPILLDCARECSFPWDNEHPPAYEDDISSGPTSPNMKYFCVNRHSGAVNGLFLDWSVRKVGLKELWTLKWRSEFDTANAWTKAGGVQPEDWPQWMRRFHDY